MVVPVGRKSASVEQGREWGWLELAEGRQLEEQEWVEAGVGSWLARRAGASVHGYLALFALHFVVAASVGVAAERSRCSFRSPYPSLGTQAGQA